MGLVVCPHCGKQVGDTNDICLHGDFNLVNNTEDAAKLREYYKLSKKERQNPKSEYLD